METIDLSNWCEKDVAKLQSIEYPLTGRPGPLVGKKTICELMCIYTLRVKVSYFTSFVISALTTWLDWLTDCHLTSTIVVPPRLTGLPLAVSSRALLAAPLCLRSLCCPPPPVTFYFSLKTQFNDHLFHEAPSDFPRQTWAFCFWVLLGPHVSLGQQLSPGPAYMSASCLARSS